MTMRTIRRRSRNWMEMVMSKLVPLVKQKKQKKTFKTMVMDME